MESRMCARYSYRTNHTCFVCKNEIFSITNYLSNFTQTLFSVVDFLGRISPIKSEKIILNKKYFIECSGSFVRVYIF
jgi:hypothetical protein